MQANTVIRTDLMDLIVNTFCFSFNFRRMNYTDAIVYLKEHDIRKDDGTFYEFGEVSTILYT